MERNWSSPPHVTNHKCAKNTWTSTKGLEPFIKISWKYQNNLFSQYKHAKSPYIKKRKKKRAALAKIAIRFQKYNFEILNTYFNTKNEDFWNYFQYISSCLHGNRHKRSPSGSLTVCKKIFNTSKTLWCSKLSYVNETLGYRVSCVEITFAFPLTVL